VSNPANPLDKYDLYTYHFELHASTNLDQLMAVEHETNSRSTTPTLSNGTLLINSRTDAFQTIDNVRFSSIGGPVPQPYGFITFDITEPGGMSFVEKLERHSTKYKTNASLVSMMYALKIIIVGRIDNKIETVVIPKLLIMAMADNGMSATFDHTGGKYHLQFLPQSYILTTPPKGHSSSAVFLTAGFTDRNITISALTVGEALRELETKLNDNYNRVYGTEYDATQGRRLRYMITINDPRIEGKLTVVNKDSNAPDSPNKLLLEKTMSISDMIKTILKSSKELNELVASSKNYGSQDDSDSKIVTMTTGYYPRDTIVELRWNLYLYTGGINSNLTWNYEYIFAESGKNVDILDFTIRFDKLNLWLAHSSYKSVDKHSDFSSTVDVEDPLQYSQQMITPDVTGKPVIRNLKEKRTLDMKVNDILFLASGIPEVDNGRVDTPVGAVSAANLSFEKYSQVFSSTNFQSAFTIRGNPDILVKLMGYPDGPPIVGIQGNSSIKIKVNIYRIVPTGGDNTPDQREQFFYTGYWQVMHVDNVFTGGKFTQILTCQMLLDEVSTEQRNNSQAQPEGRVVPTASLASGFIVEFSPVPPAIHDISPNIGGDGQRVPYGSKAASTIKNNSSSSFSIEQRNAAERAVNRAILTPQEIKIK